MKTKKIAHDRVLKIGGDYEGFHDFYDENKPEIYKTIIEVFEGFKETDKKEFSLLVSINIKDFEFDTEFKFKKEDPELLQRDLLPYFLKIEDYETCDKIKKLHMELSN